MRFLIPILITVVTAAHSQSPLELVQATYFGTAGEDDIQGGAAGPDGSIYLAGNVGAAMAKLPGGVTPTRFGENAGNAKCGRGFVLRLSADGKKVLAYAEFGEGILSLTTVQANERGVYVAGYATEHLAPLLAAVPGFKRECPLAKSDGADKSGQLGRQGAPFVVRLTADLKKLECGTYLEGSQQVWSKDRCISTKPRWKCWPTEYTWQPTHVGLLKSKDVLVCHDGGYFRDLTDADRKTAATVEDPVRSKKLLERLTFYDVCDYLSRLSPDLDQRAYRKDIYTPAVDLETVKRIKEGWPYPHYSNPRTLQMRFDLDENVYLAGWSASATSRESWWSPYIWKMKVAAGSLLEKIEEKDPMSGADNRMGGAVADRAIGSLAIDGGDLLFSSMSDGGWQGVIHFSGTLFRKSLTAKEEKAKVRTGPCFWITNVTPLPGQNVLATGRCNFFAQWADNAWQKADATENPTAWLRVYGPKLETQFSTAIRGVFPYALVPISATRYLLVGQSWGTLTHAVKQADKSYELTTEPNTGVAPTKNALYDKPAGGSDGYWMLVEVKPTSPPTNP